METYLKDLGVDVFLSIRNGYKVPKIPPTIMMRRSYLVAIKKLFIPSWMIFKEPLSPR